MALSDAWQEGARPWDAAERLAFADEGLELLAVDGPLDGRSYVPTTTSRRMYAAAVPPGSAPTAPPRPSPSSPCSTSSPAAP
ncbi:hypothetical protein [Kineococcus vitellinus]|uniref:hypothetical protein n=1 Tax=Kineococcus vitellinus TaxID=2696565 RepID=UPI00196B08CB|nr:hypothetical protein [Kineococcus vitellinus]